LHTGRDVEANVPDSGLHSGVVWHRTADQAAAGLAKHKLVFLITLFVVTEIGNIALAWANPSFAPSLRAWGVLLFSALVLTGVAALLLYIDWHVAKIGGMGLVLIAECGYFYGLYQAWHGDSQLYLLRLGVDILLLAWLWVLLLVDWRTNY